MPLVRVSIQIGLFTTTRLTMHTPLVRVTIPHQFFPPKIDKLAIHHGNDPHASDILNRFLQRVTASKSSLWTMQMPLVRVTPLKQFFK